MSELVHAPWSQELPSTDTDIFRNARIAANQVQIDRMERPGHTDRKTSFNPEATAFSPIATPVKRTGVLSSSPGAFDDEFSRLSLHPGGKLRR